jgi:hypothetical protein
MISAFSTLSLYFTFFFQNGVRGLMLDLYDFENDVWLCHSFGGQCFNYTAFVSNKWFIYLLVFQIKYKIKFWKLNFYFCVNMKSCYAFISIIKLSKM